MALRNTCGSKFGAFKAGLLLLLFNGIRIGAQTELPSVALTPVPFHNVNTDLRPLAFGKNSDYFISNYKADAETARLVCQNLTSLTGKHFRLLVLENEEEMKELRSSLDAEEIEDIWTAGEMTLDDQGNVTVVWVTEEGPKQMHFRNFRQGISVRRSRLLESSNSDWSETGGIVKLILSRPHSKNFIESDQSLETNTTVLYPWLSLKQADPVSGRCRHGKFIPECKPVECNVTVDECEAVTPDCVIVNQTSCTVEREDCTACTNCTVVPPVCYTETVNCSVSNPDCKTIRPPCVVEETPPCYTKRPPCKVTQPHCEVPVPPPCTTTKRPCVPNFQKNCTTDGSRTVCQEVLDCPPQDMCVPPPIVCPPPLYYCPPEEIICPEPVIRCPEPIIYCPNPEVTCPEPQIRCSEPQIVCDNPIVTCQALVVACPAPQTQCPPPTVTCPPPKIECGVPEPCAPPPNPPPCTEPTTEEPTTTPRPCPGCGCIHMNKEHNYKWDISSCHKEHHFICEG